MSDFFDRAFKRLMALSDPAVISLINGLYGARFPLDARLVRLNTEQIRPGDLRKQAPDSLFEIGGGDVFSLEAQTYDDKSIALRVFNYGYHYALEHRIQAGHITTLEFPLTRILYLDPGPSIPDADILRLRFSDGSCHEVILPAWKVTDYTAADLEERGLDILLPFTLLPLRHAVARAAPGAARAHLAETMAGLIDDLLAATAAGHQHGKLSAEDRLTIIDTAGRLFSHVYKAPYVEFRKVDEPMTAMLETSIDLAEKRGWRRGRRTGISEGISQGREATELKVVQGLLREGLDSSRIADILDITEDRVRELAASA